MLQYPKKSHRKHVRTPKHSVMLAELFGIIMGDGSIWNTHQFKISLNSTSDYNYALYIETLIKKLFDVDTGFMARKKEKTLVLSVSSTTIIEYLLKNGLVFGNKIKNQIDIPTWIKRNKYYSRAVVRGLTDTDGCLYLHNHEIKGKKYCNLGYCFVSYSLPLLYSMIEILNNNKIKYKIENNKKIYIYNAKEITKYLHVFDSSNERIKNIYFNWLKNKKYNKMLIYDKSNILIN